MCTIGLGLLAEANSNPTTAEWGSKVVAIATIGALAVMLVGCLAVWHRLAKKNQGFGPNSMRAIAIFLFIPSLLIVSLHDVLAKETLATLWGTVAGYVLSHIKTEADKDTKPPAGGA